ncbi:MAG: DUF3037 domain-containing protein [Caulobacteraceae bacterium]|nr:DUF3037 domain-containing protein [Caulobacteraceae bacterium]
MTNRQPYSYAVLRYRHDAVAGELINVGVLVHSSKTGFSRACLRRSYGRFSSLYPDLNGRALTAEFKRIENAVKRLAKRKIDMFSSKADAASIGKQVVDDPAGSYLWSEAAYGIADDLDRATEQLFERYVTRFDAVQMQRRSDADVWRPARDLLAERKLAELLGPKTIRSRRDEVEFDHALKNGLWHCLQPLSFDLADSDSINQKAARWVGHMVGLAAAEEEFRTYFIVGAPSQPQLREAYERALLFLSEAPASIAPRVIEEAELPTLVEELAAQVSISDA